MLWQCSDLIEQKSYVGLLAQAATQAAEDLQTESLVGSSVVAGVNIHLDLLRVESFHETMLHTRKHVNTNPHSVTDRTQIDPETRGPQYLSCYRVDVYSLSLSLEAIQIQ